MTTVPSNTYPYGYKQDGNGTAGMGTMLTMAQMETRETVYKLHPEFWRRYRALCEYALTQKVHLGVGTGWRVQPAVVKPGFAPPGNSNHEGFPADGVTGGAVAIDTVCAPSWNWMETNLKDYGLRSFKNINNEPWHVQPIEIPAARSYRKEPWKLDEYPLPGVKPPVKPPTTVPTTTVPKGIAYMGAPLVLRYGGTPTGSWSGYFSFDGINRHGVKGMHHAALLKALGAIDAKKGTAVANSNWSDVTHTNNAEELDEWLTPGKD